MHHVPSSSTSIDLAVKCGTEKQALLANAKMDVWKGASVNNLTSQRDMVTSLQSSINEFPDTGPYILLFDSLQPFYNSLPQPPSTLLDEAISGIERLVQEFTTVRPQMCCVVCS